MALYLKYRVARCGLQKLPHEADIIHARWPLYICGNVERVSQMMQSF